MSNPFDKMRKILSEIKNSSLTIGVQAEKGKNIHGNEVFSDKELRQIAKAHEYGVDIKVTHRMRAFLHYEGIHLKKDTTVIHIPERSYIRRGKKEAEANLKKAAMNIIGMWVKGQISKDEAIDKLGLQIVTETVANMGVDTVKIEDKTAQYRKERRAPTGDNLTPLIDTGNLQNHITFVVKEV